MSRTGQGKPHSRDLYLFPSPGVPGFALKMPFAFKFGRLPS
jgi:hypothetical protein